MKRHVNRGGIRKVCNHPRSKWDTCGDSWHFSFKLPYGEHFRFSVDRHEKRHVESRAEAEALAAQYRLAIRQGTLQPRAKVAPVQVMTLAQLGEVFRKRKVAPAQADDFRWFWTSTITVRLPHPTAGSLAFGDWPLPDIRTDSIEQLREVWRAARGGEVGINRKLARLRAMFNWSIIAGYTESTPFSRGGLSVIKLTREEPRCRRLDADKNEEERLLDAAKEWPILHARLVAALATACRCGELSSLQWSQVIGMRLEPAITWAPRASLFLPKEKTKTRSSRSVPITPRLRGVLELLRFRSDGEPYGQTDFVFGRDGRKVDSFAWKRPWAECRLKAMGFEPVYNAQGNLDDLSRERLKTQNLHWHDLRHEAASRWVEVGLPITAVQAMLGHASLQQTSTYLQASLKLIHDFSDRMDGLQSDSPSRAPQNAIGPNRHLGADCRNQMTVQGKAITDAYYGSGPKVSIWTGCSLGGRQAITEAERFPADYNAIVAGASAVYNMQIHAARVALNTIVNRSADSAIPPEKYALVHNAVLDACDALDGVKDGVLEDPLRCRFDPKTLECKGADGPSCLTSAQVETVRAIYSPIKGLPGPPLLQPGTELGWATLAGPSPLGNAIEPFKYVVFKDANWDWHRFNPVTDIEAALKADNGVLGLTDPNLKPFFERGGKLLMYHGWADPQVPAQNSVRYFTEVAKTVGKSAVGKSIQLYMVPGMFHCQGGPGTDTFDKVAAIEQWIEKGTAPAQIVASHSTGGKVDRTRPLCPYGQVAKWKGAGSTDDAANFSCTAEPSDTRSR